MESKSIAEIISSYFWVGSMSYSSWMPNKLGCRIMVIGSIPPVSIGCFVNYHYTRLGEVLPFSCLKLIGTQELRIMKFIQISNIFKLGEIIVILPTIKMRPI